MPNKKILLFLIPGFCFTILVLVGVFTVQKSVFEICNVNITSIDEINCYKVKKSCSDCFGTLAKCSMSYETRNNHISKGTNQIVIVHYKECSSIESKWIDPATNTTFVQRTNERNETITTNNDEVVFNLTTYKTTDRVTSFMSPDQTPVDLTSLFESTTTSTLVNTPMTTDIITTPSRITIKKIRPITRLPQKMTSRQKTPNSKTNKMPGVIFINNTFSIINAEKCNTKIECGSTLKIPCFTVFCNKLKMDKCKFEVPDCKNPYKLKDV